jgi:hypothetical protein
MRELSIEKQHDVEQAFKGKMWAYIAVVHPQEGGALGVAVANEAGYSPVPAFFAHGSYSEMVEEANRLNKARGMSIDCALRIQCSSIAAGKVAA